MKLLLGTAALGLALLSFAGSNNNTDQPVSCAQETVTIYQDTIPRKDTSSKKDRKDKKDKKERRDTLSHR